MLVNHIEAVLISTSCVTNVQKQHLSFNAFCFWNIIFSPKNTSEKFLQYVHLLSKHVRLNHINVQLQSVWFRLNE